MAKTLKKSPEREGSGLTYEGGWYRQSTGSGSGGRGKGKLARKFSKGEK